MSYALDLKYSSEYWEQIAQDADCPDVEVRVRVGDEAHRYAVKNLSNISTNKQDPTQKPRAFRIASQVKILINLAFCVYLTDEVHDPLHSFDSRAFDIHDWGVRLLSNPTILQLLLHQAAFIGLNRLMLSPDGIFMFSDARSFVRQAVHLTNARESNVPNYEYSSANHIFAALLLEKMTGLEIDEVLDKYIFQPFGMIHSTLNEDKLRSLVQRQEIELVRRYHIADILRGREVISEDFQYMSNSMEKVFLGAWSTADDLDTMFVQLMAAYHNKRSSVDHVISQRAARRFFEVSERHSLAGMLTPLQDELSLNESPNKYLRPSNEPPLYALKHILDKESYTEVYYKGGAMTGAANTVCMNPKGEVFLVVLANLAAPDVTPHIANLFLQDIYCLHPRVSIPELVRNNKERAVALFNNRCETDRDAVNWPSVNFQQFVGTYNGVLIDQTIVISKQQTMVFRRGDVISSPLSIRSSGNIVRLVPESFAFILDRQNAWSDVEFKLERTRNNVLLRTDYGKERYRKVTPTWTT